MLSIIIIGFEPDFRMDAQGMSLASPENKAQWTLAHHVEFQKRWAEFAKNMAKPNVALAAVAPSLTGVPSERARLAIGASKDACAVLWEGPYSQAGSRPRNLLKLAIMLGGSSPSIGRNLLDEDLVKLLGNIGDIKIATLCQCYHSVFSEDSSLASQASLVDTNAAAALAKYIRQNMALIMVANKMSKPNADVNVWVWASDLNVMIKELGEQHMRFSTLEPCLTWVNLA
jgi:hypothetical protein